MLKNSRSDSCYIIAEIGGNFITFEQARLLIDAAISCGVDAVKLQTYRADTIASRLAMFDMENTGTVSQFELFKKYEISEELHRSVFQYAESKGIDWFSTPSHESDVDLLEKLNVAVYKIGSDDAVNLPFLSYVARKGKPIILSTGMCTLGEVHKSVNTILQEGNDKISLLHAVTTYPTHPEDVNLRAIQTMMNAFPYFDVGYSDHTIGTTACICAAVMGAKIVEKHFTIDKTADGPDHRLSADQLEMGYIVKTIREYEIMRGNGTKRPADSERVTRVNNRKSIVLACDVNSDEILTFNHLAIKRPGDGIAPEYLDQITGRRAAHNMSADNVLHWSDLL